jgi:DNA-binding transcriptional LysR family regulator
MLDGAARIARDMETYATGGRGQVRILASVSAMTESLADDVAAFLRKPAHRSIQVDMEERVSPEIVRGVREGLASIGVCWDATDHGGLQCQPYRRDTCAWPCRRAIRWRNARACASSTRWTTST